MPTSFSCLPTFCKMKNDWLKAIYSTMWQGRFNCVFFIHSLTVKIYVQKSKKKKKQSPTMQINYSLAMYVELKMSFIPFCLQLFVLRSFAISNKHNDKTSWHAHYKNNGESSSKIETWPPAAVSNGWNSIFIPLSKSLIQLVCDCRRQFDFYLILFFAFTVQLTPLHFLTSRSISLFLSFFSLIGKWTIDLIN